MLGESITLTGATAGDLTQNNTNVACFVKGTLTDTLDGSVTIETLALGDLVMAPDKGAQPIQ